MPIILMTSSLVIVAGLMEREVPEQGEGTEIGVASTSEESQGLTEDVSAVSPGNRGRGASQNECTFFGGVRCIVKVY